MNGAALLEVSGLVKQRASPEPLRIARLIVRRGDRLTISGFDANAAELFMHLVTGAAVPEEGVVEVGGRDTRTIATDTEWLASLDRFGMVTDRAVLLDKMSIAANLALPLTVAIDPIAPELRARVNALAEAVELPERRLDEAAGSLTAVERVRVHLARALAHAPELLLLEHPTARMADREASVSLGQTVRRVADARQIGWIALSDDDAFAKAAAAPRWRLDATSGAIRRDHAWRRLFRGRGVRP